MMVLALIDCITGGLYTSVATYEALLSIAFCKASFPVFGN
jgi:hypothetical protein